MRLIKKLQTSTTKKYNKIQVLLTSSVLAVGEAEIQGILMLTHIVAAVVVVVDIQLRKKVWLYLQDSNML